MTWRSKKNSFQIAIACVLVSVSPVCRAKAQNYLIGVRGGTSFECDAGRFQQGDVFGAKYLPWLWGWGNGLNLKPRWDASAGWLNNEGREAFVGTTGPALELRVGKFPVTLEAGAAFTALSRSQFPDRDLGGWFQFTEGVGLDWHFTKRCALGWRFQHMSNASIYRQNPGLNLQMLSFSYSF